MTEKKREIKYMREQELKDFFQEVKSSGNLRDLALFKTMFVLGLRVQETVNLKLQDVEDYGDCLGVKVHRVKSGVSREYDLNEDTSRLLRRWLKARSKLENSGANLFLFPGSEGSRSLSRSTIQKAFKRYAERAGIRTGEEDFGVHVLRHSTAIYLLQKGWNLKDIKRRLGHSALASTMVYLELGSPEIKERQRRISNSFDI